jgi:Na+/serine symporter
MAFTMISITHAFSNIDGSTASGIVAFRLSERITNGSQSYTAEIPLHSTLNGSGHLSAQLPANNDPTTFPAGSTYTVSFLLNGTAGINLSGDEYTITVPYNAPGATVDLGTLLPSQVGL